MQQDFRKKQTISSNRSISGVSYTTLIVSLFVVIGITAGAFRGWNALTKPTDTDMVYTTGSRIGDTIQAEGMIVMTLGSIDYTHTMDTSMYGTIGLRSTTMSLQTYNNDRVQLQGNIVQIKDGMYIVDVTSIFLSDIIDDDQPVDMAGMYSRQAGLYFLPGYGTVASLQDTTPGQLSLLDATTQQPFTLSYFTCSPSETSKNCTQLLATFKQSNEKNLTNTMGDRFFKQQSVDSRFVTNGVYGYFIKDASSSTVEQFVNYIILPSEASVQDRIVPYVSTLCFDDAHYLATVQNISIKQQGGDMVAVLQGMPGSGSGSVSCEVTIDFSQTQGGVLRTFRAIVDSVIEDTAVQTGTETEVIPPSMLPTQEDGTLDIPTGVQQFPINLERLKTFSSRRGHTVIFPSSNISYAEQNISSDIGIEGARCFAQLNVIAYADRDLLQEQPTLKIFQCTIRDTASIPNGFRRVTVDADKDFLIEVVDTAWIQFANNIQITSTPPQEN